MKALIAASLLALSSLAATPAIAADEHAGHHGAAPKPADKAPMADGQVKKVDKAGGKVTLAHGPLVNLDMPAMTMAFRVKNAGWLDQIKAGDKIRFVADNVNGVLTVVQFETVK